MHTDESRPERVRGGGAVREHGVSIRKAKDTHIQRDERMSASDNDSLLYSIQTGANSTHW